MKKSIKSAQQYKKTKGNFRFTDFLIIVFFLLLASAGIILFRQDLLQTISLQNKKPAGDVIIKKNIVQRRLGDRVIWDRLANKSPVYLGDIIRVADVSSATLDIDNNSIDLDENTLVRIARSSDGEGFQIQVTSGKVSVDSGGAAKGIFLELNGHQIKTEPGTKLNAAAGDKGILVQVTGGTAQITNNNGELSGTGARDTPWREVSSGERIAMDVNGREIIEKAAVVTRPIPNARYLKSSNEPVGLNFEWNRINFLPEEKLRLEIAMDSNFNQIFKAINGLDRQAQASLDTGLWYWRLSFGNNVLSNGRITVTDWVGLQLVSPAKNSRFRYRDEPPELIFRWEQVEDAVSYALEVSKSPDFSSTQISAEIESVNYSSSSLREGTWYWRVKPRFPAVFTGGASFSQPSFFSIEKITVEQAAEQDVIEQTNMEKWLSSVTPSKENLPQDVPPDLVPSEWKQETKLEGKLNAKAETKPETKTKTETKQERVRPELSLLLPAQRARVEGLAALRQQTVFTWECSGKVVSSRFALSRNPNPLEGRAAVEIRNPGRSIRIDRLEEGVWFWNVEARTADGFTVSAPSARQVQVLPIPLLPLPENINPKAGERYGLEELRSLKKIVFEWKTVQGANAYIFTLYQQVENGRRQITGAGPYAGTSFLLDNLKVLENGTFIWQIEAVNIGRNGIIEQHGRTGEYFFFLDFPPPEPVHIEDAGVLYGN